MKEYKAILIDWDDTIGDFHGAARQSLRAIYEQYNLSAYFDSVEQFESIYQPHNVSLWEQYGRDEVTKEYLEFDRFFYPLMMAPRPMTTAEAIAIAPEMGKEHLNHTTSFFAPLPGSIEAVRRLAKRYPLIVASNGFVEVQYTKIERSGLKDCFTDVVLSEEIGCQKPNPHFYEEALRRNGLQAGDVLMVGDSYFSDIYGAQMAGIDQMWIVGDGSKKKEGQAATYEVTDILAVAEALA